MIGEVIGGVANLAGSLISSSMNNKAQEKMMEKQMKWQEKMNLQQQEWQEDMWNKTNEYNSAGAQMQRMMDAGINPNNAAAGITNGGQASLAAQPDIPSAPSGFNSPIDLSHIGSDIVSMSVAKAQENNIKADTEKKKAETGKVDEEAAYQKWQNFVAPEQWNMVKSEIGANVEKVLSERDMNQEKKKEVMYTVDKLLPLAYDKGLQEIDNLKKELQVMNNQIMLIKEQAKTQQAQQGVLSAQEGLYKVEKTNQEQENQIQQLKVNVANKFGISVDDLEGMDKWISTATANGTYEEAESLLTGEILDRIKKGMIKTTENPVGAAGEVIKSVKGRKGVGKGSKPKPSYARTSSGRIVSSNVNP